MDVQRRSLGINLIGWGIILSNVLLLVLGYLLDARISILSKLFPYLTYAAVFPADFFQAYLAESLNAHFFWIFLMIFCGFGILLLNQFARIAFIVLNILHIVILASMMLLRYGQMEFLDYFFKVYFNFVVCLVYVGFITIPEVREQFRADLEHLKFLQGKKKDVSAAVDSEGYFNLGIAYSGMERYEDAIGALKKAASLKPDDANIEFNLGLVFMKKKEYHGAVHAFKEAVRISPLHTKALYQLGLVYQLEGCDDEAIAAFERMLKLEPERQDVHKPLARSYLTRGRYADAIESFKKFLQFHPRDAEVYFQIGDLYLTKLEKFKEAEEAFKKALQIQPAMPAAHLELGLVFIKLNRLKDALRSFKEVVRLDDKNNQAHFQLGFTYAMLQDFESARKQCKILQDTDPDLAKTLAMLIK